MSAAGFASCESVDVDVVDRSERAAGVLSRDLECVVRWLGVDDVLRERDSLHDRQMCSDELTDALASDRIGEDMRMDTTWVLKESDTEHNPVATKKSSWNAVGMKCSNVHSRSMNKSRTGVLLPERATTSAGEG
jgi:hypothetical protein